MGIHDIDVNDYIIKPPRFRPLSPQNQGRRRDREETTRRRSWERDSIGGVVTATESYSASYILRHFLPDFNASVVNHDEFENVLDGDGHELQRDAASRSRPSSRWPGIIKLSEREARHVDRSPQTQIRARETQRNSRPSRKSHERDDGRYSSRDRTTFFDESQSPPRQRSFQHHSDPRGEVSDRGPPHYRESVPHHKHQHKRRKSSTGDDNDDDLEHLRRQRDALVDRCKAQDEILLRYPNDTEAYNMRQHLVAQLEAEDEAAIIRSRRSASHQEPPHRRAKFEDDTGQTWMEENVYAEQVTMPHHIPLADHFSRPASTSVDHERRLRTESYHEPMSMSMPMPMPHMPMPPMPLPPMPMPPMPMMPMMPPMPPMPMMPHHNNHNRSHGGTKQFKRDKMNAYQQVAESKPRPSRYYLAQSTHQIMEMVKREGAWALSRPELRDDISTAYANAKVIIIFQSDVSLDTLLGYAHMEGDIGTGLRPVWVNDSETTYFPISFTRPTQIQSSEVKRTIEEHLPAGKPEGGFEELPSEGASRLMNLIKSSGKDAINQPGSSTTISGATGALGPRKVANYASTSHGTVRASNVRAQYQAPKPETPDSTLADGST